jgi:tyrosyl-tRNA synthetase
LTDVPLAQIELWKKEAAENKVNPRDLKVSLAKSVIADFCGKPEAEKAAEEFDRVFRNKEVPEDAKELHLLVSDNINVIDLLVDCKIVSSRGEAKRLIRQGGMYLDGSRIENIDSKIKIKPGKDMTLKVGKRRFFKLIPQEKK